MRDFVYGHDSECMCSRAFIYMYCVYRCACLKSGPVSVQVYSEYSSVHLPLQVISTRALMSMEGRLLE